MCLDGMSLISARNDFHRDISLSISIDSLVPVKTDLGAAGWRSWVNPIVLG
jgi:hypothetical protein